MKKKIELYDFEFDKKFIFLNCPKCKEIPFISLNKLFPEKININCDKCKNKIEMPLNNYINTLSSKNMIKNKGCAEHNNYLDRYCYKCHIQFCSKCEISKEHFAHGVKQIKKIITTEKIEKAKNVLNDDKEYFKKYIFDFIKEYLDKFPKNKHFHITNDLMKPYINSMKTFFHICDNFLLNYDVEYPDYYQQYNLYKFLPLFKEKLPLHDLKEKKLERMFKFNNNNFLPQKIEDIILKKSLDFPSDFKSVVIDDEIIVVLEKDNLNAIKVYNYKTNNLVSTIEPSFPNLNQISYWKSKLKKINKDIFAIIYNMIDEINLTRIKIYSVYSKDTAIFEKEFDNISNIRKINDNSFGVTLGNLIEIYTIKDNFDNISKKIKSKENFNGKFQLQTQIKVENVLDLIQSSNQMYIIVLCADKINAYLSKDFSIVKTINLTEKEINEEAFREINQIDENKFILCGRIVGYFNIKDFSYKILHDDNIEKRSISYLTGLETKINYSNFVLTYFNK